MIRYPKALKKGDTIGIPAPSSGVTGERLIDKLEFAKKQLNSLGYSCKEYGKLRQNPDLTSDTKENRAKAFMKCYLDPEIQVIIPPWGGEFLMEILPLLDYDVLRKAEAKWILGFSDTSTLLFSLTGLINIATAHGPNLMDFGHDPIDLSVIEALNILSAHEGDTVSQNSLKVYQKQWPTLKKDAFPPYNLSTPVKWESLGKSEKINFKGHLYGGNLDVLCKLIGTPYDKVQGLNEIFKDSGLIWYFESCEMQPPDIYRSLWQMKMNGWFENANGFLFGRADGINEEQGFSLEKAYEKALSDLEVPIIYNADIGHLPPQITMINGAYADITLDKNTGVINQTLK